MIICKELKFVKESHPGVFLKRKKVVFDWSFFFFLLQLYPEYYEIIKEPIDLKMMCVKLRVGSWNSDSPGPLLEAKD